MTMFFAIKKSPWFVGGTNHIDSQRRKKDVLQALREAISVEEVG